MRGLPNSIVRDVGEMGKLEVLSPAECVARLGRAKVGRVGVCIGGVAEIFPVNFALMDEAIVFRTGEGTKLYVATRNHVLAFEVDDFDDEVRHGWSVLVTGPSDEITEPNELLAARELLAGTWVPTDRYHVLRIDPERISGRQIGSR